MCVCVCVGMCHGLFTLHGNEARVVTGNGTVTIGSNGSWYLSLSKTIVTYIGKFPVNLWMDLIFTDFQQNTCMIETHFLLEDL